MDFSWLELNNYRHYQIVLITVMLCLLPILGRIIGKNFQFNNRSKTIWAIDFICIPLILVCLIIIIEKLKIVNPDLIILEILKTVIYSLLFIIVTWLLNRGIELFFWTNIFELTTGAKVPRLLKTIVGFIIWVISIYLLILFVFDRPMTGLVVSTGIIVGIIGFALQGIISDIFAGIAIAIERPYKLGDWLDLKDGTLGKVVDITWRSTRLLSWNNSILIVPNNIAAQSIIHNYSMPDMPYALWYEISVDSSVSSNIVMGLLQDAMLDCPNVLNDPTPLARVSDASSRPFKYMLYVYIPEYSQIWTARSDIYSHVESYLGKAGISPAAINYEISTKRAPDIIVQKTEIQDVLKETKLFEPLSDEDIENLVSYCEIKSFKIGELIVEQDDLSSTLYIINTGIVSVIRNDESGQEIKVSQLSKGDLFGEMSLLTGEPRSASVRAVTFCELIEVRKDGLESIMKIKPRLAEQIAEIMLNRQKEIDVAKNLESNLSSAGFFAKFKGELVSKIESFFGLK